MGTRYDGAMMGNEDDERWAAVLRRDRAVDGAFVTGVLSTGIYCRPSCAARHPARRNVRFFGDGAAARAAGLRACRRCLPDDVARDAAAVERAKTLLDTDLPPRLDALAAAVGYSPTHFQRVFARQIGLSPAAYVRARRAARAAQQLRDGGPTARISDAMYDSGYAAPSRFYDAMKGRLAMTPSAWKNGGAGIVIHWTVAPTTLGPMLLAATAIGVCRLSFDEGEAELRDRFPHADLVRDGAMVMAYRDAAVEAVERPGAASDIPLDIGGTAFQRAIWAALQAIPPGETRSYAELAASIGRPKAVRAAGSANGANTVAVLIPCHRVIRADGSSGGYAYGTARKDALLEREKGSS